MNYCIRLNQTELERLQELTDETGLSKAEIFKQVLFSKKIDSISVLSRLDEMLEVLEEGIKEDEKVDRGTLIELVYDMKSYFDQ